MLLFHSELNLVSEIADHVTRTLHGIVTRSDLVSAGQVGLFQAACRFDQTRKVPFRAFARPRVHGAMIDYVRSCFAKRTHDRQLRHPRIGAEPPERAKARPRYRTISLVAGFEDVCDATPHLRSGAGESDSITPTHAARTLSAELSRALSTQRATPHNDPEAQVARAETLDHIRASVESFPPYERAILLGHYFDDREFQSIARELNLDRSWVARIHARALKRLAKRLRL